MMRFLTVGVLMSAALVLAKPASAQDPALADLLARAADYHASYAVRVSGATVEENYSLTRLVAGRMETPIRFASDVVLRERQWPRDGAARPVLGRQRPAA